MTTAVGRVPQTTEIQQIQLAHLLPHPANRKQFNPTKLAELVASIEKVGIHTPLIIRACADPGPAALHPAFEIIAGERRWRAAQQVRNAEGGVGLATVPCIVRELDDDAALELLLTENLQREDPHPLEEADAYAAWLARPGHDVRELAARIGKSVAHVYSRLQLRSLTDEARDIVWKGQLPIAHAQVLARLQPAQQAEAVERVRVEIERDADLYQPPALPSFLEDITAYQRNLENAPFPIDDAELCPGAGACHRCPKRTGFTDGVFPELAEALQTAAEGDPMKDTCLDPTCWDEKTAAHVARAVLQARDTYGESLVLLSQKFGNTYPAKKDAPLPRGVWTKSTQKTKGAVPGILVKQDSMGGTNHELGDLVWVTLAPRPKEGAKAPAKKASSSGSWDQAKYEAERKAREERGNAEVQRRLVVAKAIIAKVPAKLEVELVKKALIGELQSYQLRQTAKALGVAIPSPEKSDGDLNRALVLSMIAEDLNAWSASQPGAEMEQLPSLAKRFGVDIKKLLADYDATQKPAADAKATPVKAKAGEKKRAGDVARAKKAKKGGKK